MPTRRNEQLSNNDFADGCARYDLSQSTELRKLARSAMAEKKVTSDDYFASLKRTMQLVGQHLFKTTPIEVASLGCDAVLNPPEKNGEARRLAEIILQKRGGAEPAEHRVWKLDSDDRAALEQAVACNAAGKENPLSRHYLAKTLLDAYEKTREKNKGVTLAQVLDAAPVNSAKVALEKWANGEIKVISSLPQADHNSAALASSALKLAEHNLTSSIQNYLQDAIGNEGKARDATENLLAHARNGGFKLFSEPQLDEPATQVRASRTAQELQRIPRWAVFAVALAAAKPGLDKKEFVAHARAAGFKHLTIPGVTALCHAGLLEYRFNKGVTLLQEI